ncbi:hypothetical protein Ae707Ps1_5749c [Pseudonocardia sp. Ae707_Ps1]|nr:hypothetical protein Ae707Ps1_5749c [Pseudonocardia sp. Ae707_Ps1]
MKRLRGSEDAKSWTVTVKFLCAVESVRFHVKRAPWGLDGGARSSSRLPPPGVPSGRGRNQMRTDRAIRPPERWAAGSPGRRIPGPPGSRAAGSRAAGTLEPGTPERRASETRGVGLSGRRVARPPDAGRGTAPPPGRRAAGPPDRQAAGPLERRTAGLLDCRTAGLPDCRAVGQQGRWTAGQSGIRAAGPYGGAPGGAGRPPAFRTATGAGPRDRGVREKAAPATRIPSGDHRSGRDPAEYGRSTARFVITGLVQAREVGPEAVRDPCRRRGPARGREAARVSAPGRSDGRRSSAQMSGPSGPRSRRPRFRPGGWSAPAPGAVAGLDGLAISLSWRAPEVGGQGPAARAG